MTVPLVLGAVSARELRALAAWARAELAAPHDRCGFSDAHRQRCHTADTLARRDRPEHRFRLVALGAVPDDDVLPTRPVPAPGPLAFLFSGQSSQRPGMGAGLGAAFPLVDATVDEVARHVDPRRALGLRTAMAGDDVHRTEYAQPALLAVALGLHRLLASVGVEPDVVCGHSFGELAAAAAAGVWTLPDACAVVAERGRLCGAVPPGGAMVAIEAGEAEVAAVLPGDVVLSAVHGPRAVVVAGPAGPVRALGAAFAARGVRTSELPMGVAAHSPAMDPVLAPLAEAVAAVPARPGRVPVVSAVTGARADVTTPAYWVRHCRDTVRWADVMATLHGEGVGTYLEVGPSGVLSRLAAANLPDGSDDAVVPVLTAEPDEPTAFLSALARLDARGHRVDWGAMLDAVTPL